jgi:hypothetical protein
MRKTNQTEMEMKVKKAVRVEGPGQAFVESLRHKIEEQAAPTGRPTRVCPLFHQPVWLTLLNVIVLLSAVLFTIGPKNAYASIKDFFNLLDPGLQTVEAAGLVTELEITAQATVTGTDGSVEDITVTLDWVYLDEGRLVLGFVTSSIPSGCALENPVIVAGQTLKSNLTFSSVSEGEDADQIIFSAYNPLQENNRDKQVDFSVILHLIDVEDPARVPLAEFHYDLVGIPVHKGQTIDMEQTTPARVDDIEFQVESFVVTQSFSEVVFCSDLSADKVLALPKSDISLQIGDGPVMYGYLVLGMAEGEGQTCVQIGFFDGSSMKDEMVIFRFKETFVAIIQSAPFDPGERIDKPIPKP